MTAAGHGGIGAQRVASMRPRLIAVDDFLARLDVLGVDRLQ